MPAIEFRENKVLKLTNVLMRQVPANEMLNSGKQVTMLHNWIKSKGYTAVGPLITYTTGAARIDLDGNPRVESYLLQQIKQDKVRLEVPYRFESAVRIENCLMARFTGGVENMQYATMKLQVYAYENDLELTGETYMVFMEQSVDRIAADVFMPVKGSLVTGS